MQNAKLPIQLKMQNAKCKIIYSTQNAECKMQNYLFNAKFKMLLFFIIIRLCRQYNARNNICYITIFFIQLIIIRNGNILAIF